MSEMNLAHAINDALAVALDGELPIVMIPAHGTVDKAVEAMQKGAYTYVLKPFDNERLILYVKKAVAGFQVALAGQERRTSQSAHDR